MIKRTSDEKVINMKVNINEARASFPDTKRCVNPDLNQEVEKVKPHHIPGTLAEKLRYGNDNLLSGKSLSALDERVKSKQRWKLGLINKYENNQQMWGDLTNSFVNKLKEEVNYNPAKDFKKENDIINERLAKKLEIMNEQCTTHKENMLNNPITGKRNDSQSVSRRKQSQYAREMGTSDIHSLRGNTNNNSRIEERRASLWGGESASSKVDLRSSCQMTTNNNNRDKWAGQEERSLKSHNHSVTELRHNQRDRWAK